MATRPRRVIGGKRLWWLTTFVVNDDCLKAYEVVFSSLWIGEPTCEGAYLGFFKLLRATTHRLCVQVAKHQMMEKVCVYFCPGSKETDPALTCKNVGFVRRPNSINRSRFFVLQGWMAPNCLVTQF
jgi:hypothetical protein